MNQKLKVIGFDPSLRNWGMSSCLYTPETQSLEILDFGLIQPKLPKGKVKQGELDILSGMQLFTEAHKFIQDADIVCAEIPVGSQSARAMVSYATCTAIIGALISLGMPLVAVTPLEVKKVIGNDQASKHDVIQWVQSRYPYAPFPTFKRDGQDLISEAKAEHMADSVVAIHAAMQKQRFKDLVELKS